MKKYAVHISDYDNSSLGAEYRYFQLTTPWDGFVYIRITSRPLGMYATIPEATAHGVVPVSGGFKIGKELCSYAGAHSHEVMLNNQGYQLISDDLAYVFDRMQEEIQQLRQIVDQMRKDCQCTQKPVKYKCDRCRDTGTTMTKDCELEPCMWCEYRKFHNKD